MHMRISMTPKTRIARATALIVALALALGAVLYPITTHAETASNRFECTVENAKNVLTELEEQITLFEKKIDSLEIDTVMSLGELIDVLSDIDLMLQNLERCVKTL